MDPIAQLLSSSKAGDLRPALASALITDEPEPLASLAAGHRVLGPTLLAVLECGRDVPRLIEALVGRLQGAMAWCLELELRLLEVADWFDEAGGVEFLVLKGPAVAHLDEIDPSLRSFADLDLLIHERDMDRAIAALERHGAVRRIPQRRPGFDRRFVKGVGMTCPDGIEIDVHRTLCVGALGFRIPLEELFVHPAHFTVGGRQYSALRLEHRALHAAYHAVVGSPEPALHTLRDLAQYLSCPSVTIDRLADEAERWGGLAVLHQAALATFDTLRTDLIDWRTWAASVVPSRRDLRIIEQSRRAARWPIDLPMLRELGPVAGAAYVWAVAVPAKGSPDHRTADRFRRHFHRLTRRNRQPA